MTDIVEFLKTARSFKSQIEILDRLLLPIKEQELTKEVVAEINKTISKYLKGIDENGAM